PDDRNAIRTLSAEIRRTVEGIAIPDDVAAAITLALAGFGQQAAYAVRSSATAEDSPTASFAGQHDRYLHIVAPAAVLQTGRRDAGRDDRGGAAGAASTDGCAGRAARAAGPARRSALQPPPGHRMVPGGRWLRDRPEPADHHAVPHPRGRRRREPCLRLRRSSADDDRPHEAPGALRVPADGPPRMYEAGGRLFVDVTERLASRTSR